MKLTMEFLKEHITIDGLSFAENEGGIGTKFCTMKHKNPNVIYDLNQWLLDHFPNRWDDITQGQEDGSNKHYISVTLDDGAVHEREERYRIEKILNYQPEWTRLIFRLDATGYPSNEKIAEVASYYHVNEKMLKQAIIKKMQSTA